MGGEGREDGNGDDDIKVKEVEIGAWECFDGERQSKREKKKKCCRERERGWRPLPTKMLPKLQTGEDPLPLKFSHSLQFLVRIMTCGT